jgi:hypothetical protein
VNKMGSTQSTGKVGQTLNALPGHIQGLADTMQSAVNVHKMAMQQLSQANISGNGEAYYGGNALVTGGYFGGDDQEDPSKALKEYRHSLSAAAKDRVARGLARALKSIGIDVSEDDSLETIARKLQKQLPNPRKGKSFPEDAKKQENVCKAIATALNNEFTPGASSAGQLIDMSLGAVSICRQVAELVYSLSAGVHTEFLEVHASLTRVLKNLEVLDEVLRELYSKTKKVIKKADLSVGADKKLAALDDVYDNAEKERKHQMSILKNILHVTLAPAKEELALAMREEGETHDMIKKLKLIPGTGKFADALAEVVSGLGTAAAVTARVDKALKEVGLSIESYLKSPSRKALEKSLDDKLMSGDISEDEVGKFLDAVRTLRENYHRRSELDFGALKATGGKHHYDGGKHHYNGGKHHYDGGGSTLDKRIEHRKMERKLIVKEFIDKSSRQYAEFLKAIESLGPHLGKEIPLSDKLESLRNALSRLSQSRLGALNLELSLIGFYAEAAAREKKETFLAGLRMVRNILDELMSMEIYQKTSRYFAAMRAALDGLVRTIDFYSGVITKKFGSGDSEEKEGGKPTKKGGQPEELAAMPEIARSSFDLEKAINTFMYFYFVAKVRANLKQTSEELEYYGEKYQNILGDAVAARLRDLLDEKKQRLKAFADLPVPAGDAPKKAHMEKIEEARTFIENEYKCKVKFYNALQALDLYMKAFTDGIVSDPDAVKDVKSMIDGVSVIGRWFVEDTGDALAAAFDVMPGFDGTGRTVPDITAQSGQHYYEKVAKSTTSRDVFTPGIPQLGTTVAKGKSAAKEVSRVYDNFQALKNITNAFVRIGNKFKGKEIRRQTFMTPTQIYKALIDYLKCSALSIGLSAAEGDSPPTVAGAPAYGGDVEKEFAVYFASCQNGFKGDFEVEDRYFSYCVKAMAAKILTVIGVYDLFERPSPVYELTPTRMIIGGYDGEKDPEVIPEATELYFRFPRLVEFYKDLLFKQDDVQEVQIGMLPPTEGPFSGIIRLIFMRVQGGASETGDYSDMEVRQLIREINKIYESFRGSTKGHAVNEALSSFVMEINRRYGIVKKKEYDALEKLLREMRGTSQGSFGDLNRTNFAILPGEEEYEGTRRAPSDRFLGPGDQTPDSLGLKSKFSIDPTVDSRDWKQWKMLTDFRKRLDRLFSKISPEEFTTYSFSTVIRQGELEIRRAKDLSAQINIVARLIQGSGSLAGIDVGKSFMFHETVVVGLNLLNAIHTILARIRQQVVDTDVAALTEALKTWVKTEKPGAINKASIDTGLGGGISVQAKTYVRPDDNLFLMENGAGNARARHLYAGVARLITAAGVGEIPEWVAETFAAHAIDSGRIMEDLLHVIIGLTLNFQGMVNVRFPNTAQGQVHLDFSGLRNVVQGLMNDVRFFMDMFRPHISKNVIKKFEDRSVPGSLYWLEENLFDKIIRGVPGESPASQKTLEWMSRTVNKSYTLLTGYVRYSLSGLTMADDGTLGLSDGGPNPLSPRPNGQHYRQYGRLLCKLAFYNAASLADNSGITAPTVNAIGGGISSLISTGRPSIGVGGVRRTTLPTNGTLPTTRRIRLWGERSDWSSADRSLLIMFNELVAKYLSVFYDTSTGKIYRPLIDSFANGSFSRAVMSAATAGNTLPDLATAGGRDVFGVRGDPKAQGILTLSLGLILQRLATDISPSTQISDHLVSTLSEIPLYIRESFRANLPVFVKFFELVQKKGEFIKQLMNQTRIQCGRPYGPSARATEVGAGALAENVKVVLGAGQVVTDTASNSYPIGSTLNSVETLASTPTDSDGTKARILTVINGVSSGCYTLANAGAGVLREIADEPLYLQTQENSIQEYRARYGKMPLMPLSTSLTYLKNLASPEDKLRLMPVHSVGDVDFKLMYGTRKLLGRPKSKFTLSDAPGIRANLEAFNAASSGREKIDADRYQNFLTNATSMLRYLVDMRSYVGALEETADAKRNILQTDLVAAVGGDNIGIFTSGDNSNSVYAIRVEPLTALAVTESSYQDEELKKLGEKVGGAALSLGGDRKKEWITNIIEMNIIPINVHALMRGIPLAPLYNYVYTFEQMACLMFGETAEHVGSLVTDVTRDNGVKNTKQMFLRMLMEPYAEIPQQSYGGMSTIRLRATAGLVNRIFRGDDSLKMGRPKFLSDQVFNKALFGSLVPTPYDFDEAGPPASGAIRRGRDMVGGPGSRPTEEEYTTGLLGEDKRAVFLRSRGVREDVKSMANPVTRLLPMDAPYGGPEYGALTYIGSPSENGDSSTALKRVGLGGNTLIKMRTLEEIGLQRFNTRIVRNLMFITNIQRLVRLKLNEELTQYRNVIVSNHSVVNPGVTEYGFMPPSTGSIPFGDQTPQNRSATLNPGPMETSESRFYDNDRRLVE